MQQFTFVITFVNTMCPVFVFLKSNAGNEYVALL